ncbi:MAG TPA: hypothetical protein VL475_09140, partial [Planctomycetaceae bacterium]|nr:hypothetical protein [Planctomycetaceae bacterium]
EQAPPRPQAPPAVELVDRPSLSATAAVGLLWKATAVVIAQAVELFLIVSVIGARRRTEAQVGFIGSLGAVVWLLLCGMHHLAERFEHPPAFDWLAAVIPQSLAISYGYGDASGTYGDLAIASRVGGPLLLNSLVLVGLGVVFSLRYGTRRVIPAESPSAWPRWQFPYLLSRLPICFPGPVGALVWLDLRRALPLAATGLALAYLITAANLTLFEPNIDVPLFLAVAGHLPGTTWCLATLWATIVAAGLFAPELQPGLESFWRSRPIPPGTWFWTKFLTGLVATLGMLDGVTIVASWNSPYADFPDRMSRSYVACMPILHGFLYALAVLAVCRFRRPNLGALTAIGAYALVSVALTSIPAFQSLEPIAVYNRLIDAERAGFFDLAAHDYPLVYGGLAATAVAVASVASRLILRAERH